MDDKIIKVAAGCFVGLVVMPTVIGIGVSLVAKTVDGINNLAYKHKIKKGLKDGSIIEIDGHYYEVDVLPREEA